MAQPPHRIGGVGRTLKEAARGIPCSLFLRLCLDPAAFREYAGASIRQSSVTLIDRSPGGIAERWPAWSRAQARAPRSAPPPGRVRALRRAAITVATAATWTCGRVRLHSHLRWGCVRAFLPPLYTSPRAQQQLDQPVPAAQMAFLRIPARPTQIAYGFLLRGGRLHFGDQPAAQ